MTDGADAAAIRHEHHRLSAGADERVRVFGEDVADAPPELLDMARLQGWTLKPARLR